ncbi:MAG: nitrophenyl compound nitroreductase subunit ArsF family protein [Planctomycetaceae bacterium]|nr:nitrophenyl compound nitroreductase subunit ArsF family protein [Planctomycetaceae bacterium]
MELKNAVAVCLISLFSATLVVLIARSLDSQAASRIEPQLANIVEELRAIRSQGGIPASGSNSSKTEPINDGLVVYYFHGNIRCPTCQSIESQSHETVKKHFAAQLEDGTLAWKILNYEQPIAKPLATKFDVQMPVVVLARMKEGQVKDWKRLDEVWGLVGDKPAFAKFVRGEIERMLVPEKQKPSATAKKKAAPSIPLPLPGNTPAKAAPSIPIPQK